VINVDNIITRDSRYCCSAS